MQLQTNEPLYQIMLARYYGDSLPRFLSPDPIGGSPGRPQSWNRYAYVLGNPMKLVDPTGMYWAPGTTPPGGTAGPWGPCYACHDFSGGNPWDSAVAYFHQEQRKRSRTGVLDLAIDV